jgi:diacylglycerol kinase (ATP)
MTSAFGPLTLIVNPVSGRGKVAAALPRIEEALRREGLEHRIEVTRGPGDATRATRRALEGDGRFVVAVGGDGTIHEVVNGMFADGRPVREDAVLGVVAAGSGSDFVRTFDLPGDATGGCAHLAGEATRPLDVGKVTYLDDPSGQRQGVRYFANIAEVGLGAATVARAAALPRSIGRSRYFLGFWITLPGFANCPIRLSADDRRFAGRVHNVVIANGRYFGGGMHVSPGSQPDDGAFDVLVMKGPKSDSFTTIPKVYRGAHLPDPDIVELTAAHVRVDADRPLPIEADGEVLGTTPATFELLLRPLRLKV